MFQVGQIVKGIRAGTFRILSFRSIGGQEGVQLKEVNPNDHSKEAKGELWLPLDAVVSVK